MMMMMMMMMMVIIIILQLTVLGQVGVNGFTAVNPVDLVFSNA